jgi:hypothetical protein
MYSKETGTPNFIYFLYSKQSLFDNVSLRTMYRAKNLKDQQGESQIDDYAMSSDEMDAFNLFIETAVYDAFSIVAKMTTGTTSPIVLNEDIIPTTGGEITDAYGFKILDEAAYNPNILYSVDDGVQQYIISHIMSAWYDLVGHDAEFAKWEAKKNAIRTDLITKRLFQLRKPLLS